MATEIVPDGAKKVLGSAEKEARRFIPMEIVGGPPLSEDSSTEDLVDNLDALLEVGMAAILEGGNNDLSSAQYAGMYCLRAAYSVVSELQRRRVAGSLIHQPTSAQGDAA